MMTSHSAGPEHVIHRREALKLVMVTSSAVLNLRSPLDSGLPGRSIDKFTAMLFGSEVRCSFQQKPVMLEGMRVIASENKACN